LLKSRTSEVSAAPSADRSAGDPHTPAEQRLETGPACEIHDERWRRRPVAAGFQNPRDVLVSTAIARLLYEMTNDRSPSAARHRFEPCPLRCEILTL